VLDERTVSALKAIALVEDPKDKRWVRTLPKLSVADICKTAGRSRSAVYEYHKDFVTDALAAKDTVDKALADRVWSFRRQTKTGLKERLVEVEAQLEQERAQKASKSLTPLIERLGPFVADRQRASAELQQIRDENAVLREQLRQAHEQNRRLTILLNSGGKL
jgi:AcrR family transcriptional regulator